MIDWLVKSAYASGQPSGPGGTSGWATLLLPLMILFAFYYFLIHLPQRKRQQERKRLLDNLKRGDEVLTTGGIYGKVTGVADQNVTLEIAPKIRIKVHKSSITQVTARSEGGEEKEKEKE